MPILYRQDAEFEEFSYFLCVSAVNTGISINLG